MIVKSTQEVHYCKRDKCYRYKCVLKY